MQLDTVNRRWDMAKAKTRIKKEKDKAKVKKEMEKVKAKDNLTENATIATCGATGPKIVGLQQAEPKAKAKVTEAEAMSDGMRILCNRS